MVGKSKKKTIPEKNGSTTLIYDGFQTYVDES
jgi:hypothetical protein